MSIIHFYANLRTLANQPSLDLDTASFSTLRAVLAELTRIYPQMDFHLLDSNGNLRSDVPIFINGRNPRLQSTDIDSIILKKEDDISIFSPISSGRMNVQVMREPTFSKRK
jgi:molybdopterin converting factor small subunit